MDQDLKNKGPGCHKKDHSDWYNKVSDYCSNYHIAMVNIGLDRGLHNKGLLNNKDHHKSDIDSPGSPHKEKNTLSHHRCRSYDSRHWQCTA